MDDRVVLSPRGGLTVSPRATFAEAAWAFALGLVFAVAGASKLLAPAAPVAEFARWGLPAPHLTVVLAGTLELGGAVMLMTDVGLRAAAILLAAEMTAATVVAGGHDGGVQLVVPPALAVALLGLAAVRTRAIQPAQGTSTESSVGESRATTYSAGSVSERFSRMWVSRGGT